MIHFFSEDTDFKLNSPKNIVKWLNNSIDNEGMSLGEINYIFCSDDFLYKMNKEYLNHDTYTDIITFNYVEKNIISGEMFISVDRVKENAAESKVDFLNELNRVIIHGVLHLIGYDDKTPTDAQEIRAKEDFYLALHC